MAIDRKRLRREAKAAEKARPPRSVGRPTTGALAAVEANLDTIHALRKDGVRWAAIAAALSEQGVHQLVGGERRPLTAARLTALVHSIEKRQALASARRAGRATRPGLVGGATSTDGTIGAMDRPERPIEAKVDRLPPRSVELAPELQRSANPDHGSDVPPHADEEELRRSRLAAVRRLTKD